MSDTAPEDRALWFFQAIVEPTVKEFMNDWSDLRRGCLAAIALASMADHYFHARRECQEAFKNADAFRGDLAACDEDYRLTLEVANGTKHAVRRDPDAVGMAQMQRRSLRFGEGRFGEGRFGGPPQVIVEVAPGDPRVLEGLVEATAAMWRKRLGIAGA